MIEILHLNVLALYFLYGLSFYTMGVGIALQYRSYSSFKLAQSLSLLAAFALLHGLSEWGSVFMPVRVPDFGDLPLWKLIAVQRLLQSVSYFFLFCFGVKLISDSKNQNFNWWVTLPTIAFLAWLALFLRFIPAISTDQLVDLLLHSDCYSRYILAFPAGAFTAYGLYLQISEASLINDKSVIRDIWVATFAFAFFAIFSGLVVPHYNVGFLSKVLNAETFRHFTGFPVEVFRTITAFLATWSITSMLGIFDLEKQRQVTESRRLEAVFRERERFARDLHDDVIQAVYAVGLDLQTTINLIGNDNEKASERISSTVKRLNSVIHVLRAYIYGLETQGDQDLKVILENVIKQFQKEGGPKIKFNYQVPLVAQVKPSVSMKDWQQQLRQIVREALNNVVQHAEASDVQVDTKIEGGSLVVTVRDNGRGLPPGDPFQPKQGRKRMGLDNMRTRAMLLGGDIQLFSKPGEGTRVVINIPLSYEKQVS